MPTLEPNNKGQVALFVAMSMSVMLLYIGLYTINRNIAENNALTDATNSMSSFYLADMGTERFLYELKTSIADGSFTSLQYLADSINGGGSGIPVTVGNGTYEVVATGNIIKIKGSYRDVNRAIELTYAP